MRGVDARRENPKIPNSKKIPNPKQQNHKKTHAFEHGTPFPAEVTAQRAAFWDFGILGFWDLGFGIYLGFGILGFGIFRLRRTIAAAMNEAKSGCGAFGFDWNSG